MTRLALILSTLTGVIALLGGVRWACMEWRQWRHRRRLGLWLIVMIAICCWPTTQSEAVSVYFDSGSVVVVNRTGFY